MRWNAACLLALAACGGGEIGEPGAGTRGLPGRDGPGVDMAGAPGAGAGGAGGGGAGGGAFQAAESVSRRLTRSEIDATLRDLLGDDANAGTAFLAEDAYGPYDNDYTKQRASAALIDSLERMAEDVATRVMADATLRASIVPCTPATPGDEACFRMVVEGLVARAFRRPVTSAEVDAYLPLLVYATEDNPDVPHDFNTAVELVLRAVIQDPEFLYRVEVGTATSDTDVYALDDHEIATRASYLLWGTMPDAALTADAVAGRLADANSRRDIAQRMLQDDRARAQLHRFHAMWLGYRAIPHTAELAAAFHRETTALLDRIIFDEPQNYMNLFTADETWLDDFLADHYGLPHPNGGEGWVKYGTSGRAGLLSHGAVLSAFGKFSDTSPTQRGKFVRTRLMCQEIQRPPVNVVADKPPGDADAVCKIDRYEQHRSSDSCKSCHGQMDPIGFGLENYDLAGRYRTHDEGLTQCTIAGKGELVPYGTFSGPAELGRLLVDEGLLDQCIVQQFFSFAVGRASRAAEVAAVGTLTTGFAADGHLLGDMIVEYVASDAFARRREPTDPEKP